MSYVKFTDTVYKYWDEKKQLCFIADDSHNYLFEYVVKDLSKLPELLESYICKKMDFSTYEIIEAENSIDEILEIEHILKSLHPFYEFESKKIIIKAIGDYFNDALLHSIVFDKFPSEVVTEQWYFQKYYHLTCEILSKSEDYPETSGPRAFYNKFKAWNHDESRNPSIEIEEKVWLGPSHHRKIAFHNEIYTQNTIANMLYYILNIDTPAMEHLSLSQRVWFYGNLRHYSASTSSLKVIQHLSFFPQPYLLSENSSDFIDDAVSLYDTFAPLHNLNNINAEQYDITSNTEEAFRNAVKSAETITASKIYAVYEIQDLLQLLYLEITSMIQCEVMIRKCKNCGKYFIIKNRNALYCSRINEFGKSCFYVGTKSKFNEKMNNEEELKIYNRAYKTHYARFKNGRITRPEFNLWVVEAKAKLEEVRTDNLDIATFQEWLKK